MAKFFLHIILALVNIPLASVAKQTEADSLIRLIDEAINQSEQYVTKRQERITTLKTQFKDTEDENEKYAISFRLYEEYKPFINDSAIHYLKLCMNIAKRSQQPQRHALCGTWLALRCSNMGMYDEAKTILGRINPDEMGEKDKGIYYFAYSHLYGELAYYTHLEDMRQAYYRQLGHYHEMTFRLLPPHDDNRMQILEQTLINQKRYKESKAVNDEWLRHVKPGSYTYALVALYRYFEYKATAKTATDSLKMMKWLAVSVLTDIRNGVMDQGSMWEMANQLMLTGDVDRAYRYINFTSDCANRFGSRTRISQISPLLATIAQQYKEESRRSFLGLMVAIGLISIFTLVIFALYVYANRQRHKLSEARTGLRQSNEQLSVLNNQLNTLIKQLQDSNVKLADTNRVKDEYLGHFMRLCSIYVDRLNEMRKKVNRMVKKRQFDEVYELTRSSEFKQHEIDELYANFDSAFLNLFPDFVNKFNALLRPEERIQLAKKDSLNTPIRIFALIRLGIDDSSKIAEFLHYSVNTIYNYRAHVKNGAIGDRKTFEEQVKEIGAK